MKPKRKPITDTVDPAILERARASNVDFNKHLSNLRASGYTDKVMVGTLTDHEFADVGASEDISLELSVMMVEAASIIAEVEQLQE